MKEDRVTIDELVLADEPERWSALGFDAAGTREDDHADVAVDSEGAQAQGRLGRADLALGIDHRLPGQPPLDLRGGAAAAELRSQSAVPIPLRFASNERGLDTRPGELVPGSQILCRNLALVASVRRRARGGGAQVL